MFNLLSFFSNYFDGTEKILTFILILTIIVGVLVVYILCSKTKYIKTKTMAFMGVMLSLSFVLSFVKIKIGLNGGSVTLFSLVPIILFSYIFGVYYGLIAGTILGVLQFISSPYILTPFTFFLDYIFAYGSICFASIFKKIIKNNTLSISLGTTFCYIFRIIFATISGIVYFKVGFVYEGYPTSNAFVYSFVYNILYLVPDMLICLLFFIAFTKSKNYNKLISLIEN